MESAGPLLLLDLAGRTWRHIAFHCGSRGRRPPLSEPSAVKGFMNGLPTSNSFVALEPDVPAPSSHGASEVPSVSAKIVMASPGTKVGSASPGSTVGSAIPIICGGRVRGAPDGARVGSMKQIPALKTVVLYIGSNDIMCKLAGHIIVSGPIPSPRRCGTKCFIHLWTLHQWLMHLTKDFGMSFVDNSDSFSNRPGYFVAEGIHLGENGSRLLSSKIGKVLVN
uniref:SGNH hydrolase-type esterase domain-containing protein n=1 Tax=Hucho hucho TaxID=62062 RepID=A0A4W5PLV2_9TELE